MVLWRCNARTQVWPSVHLFNRPRSLVVPHIRYHSMQLFLKRKSWTWRFPAAHECKSVAVLVLVLPVFPTHLRHYLHIPWDLRDGISSFILSRKLENAYRSGPDIGLAFWTVSLVPAVTWLIPDGIAIPAWHSASKYSQHGNGECLPLLWVLGKVIRGSLRRHHALNCFSLHLFAHADEVVQILLKLCDCRKYKTVTQLLFSYRAQNTAICPWAARTLWREIIGEPRWCDAEVWTIFTNKHKDN